MANTADIRRAIRPLLDERNAADAMAAYYALHHPAERTRLVPYPAAEGPLAGFVALSRTGLDLFRPLVTMRLPTRPANAELDLEAGAELIQQALEPSQQVIVHTREQYLPLLQALFQTSVTQTLQLFRLDPARFEPIVNVFVVRTVGPNGLPRFVIRHPPESPSGEVLASASLNWQSPQFADIAVYTSPRRRRQGYGRSVVSAMVQHLLDSGKIPVYFAGDNNQPSIELAQRLGFINTLTKTILLEGYLT